jgi:hypothetical protein
MSGIKMRLFHQRKTSLTFFLQVLMLSPAHLFAGPFYKVKSQEIFEAMQTQSEYDVTATTNVARFQASVLLEIVNRSMAFDSSRSILFIRHIEWMDAYMEYTGLTKSTLPIHAQLSLQNRQDLLLDFTQDRVIEKIEAGEEPRMALNVIVGWPDEGPGTTDKYSFQDTLSTPKLQVTNHREITFRLLDFGDMIVYDDIRGLTGRPTSGLLGVLFRVIGEGSVVQSRMKITPDGLQVNRAHAEKGLIGITETVTVRPDGSSEKGLPDDRPDLLAIEERLKRPLDIKYLPLGFEQLDAVWPKQSNHDADEDKEHE